MRLKTSRNDFLNSRERFMGREALGMLDADQAELVCLKFIICLRNNGFQTPG
jgi:hypothetical protein